MTGWRVHGWVLMTNHYHLLVETPEANLVAGMKWLQNTWTRRFNTRHRLWGRLFGDRYKAVMVDGNQRYYYETLLDYIHLNPVRAGLIRPAAGQSITDYAWSSVADGYVKPARQRRPWLAVDAGLEAFGMRDTVSGRRRFVERLDRRAVEEGSVRAGLIEPDVEVDKRCSQLQRGWYWGSQEFAERLVKLGEVVLKKPRHRSAQASGASKAHGEQEARRLLSEGLAAAGLDAAAVKQLKGSDARKVAIASVIWQNTTVSMSWVAEHLSLKSAANASQQLGRWQKRNEKLPASLRQWANLSGYVA